MKKLVLSAIIFSFVGLSFAQTLRTHNIKSDDTLDAIAQLYGVTVDDILRLNPDASTQLLPNQTLVIPNPIQSDIFETTKSREVVSYRVHRVKRKETLFSIAQKYNVLEQEIIEHNQKLVNTPLQYKDKIYIPKYKTKTIAVLPQALKTYVVLPKEGKWRVAYKFGISVQELEALNPGLGSVLKEGQKLNVPNINSDQELDVSDEQFDYYKVLPKEGYYRLSKKLGLTQKQLEELNPNLIETGLQVGMILKIPKHSLKSTQPELDIRTELTKSLQFFEPKSVALLLPFKANSVTLDSVELAKHQLQRDGYIRIATEFYAGVEMALDSLKRLGISTTLDVFDTEAKTSTVSRLLQTKDFSSYDFVLGPMTSKNTSVVAEGLSDYNIAVVTPFVKLNKSYPNLIQTIPTDDWMADKMLNFVNQDTIPSQILIISDSHGLDRVSKIQSVFPNAQRLISVKDDDGVDQFYIDFETVKKALNPGKTLVFLESNNESFVSNVSSMLNGLNGVTFEKDEHHEDKEIKITRNLTLMTTNHNTAFMGQNVSNTDLSNLNFQFPSVHFNKDHLTSFVKNYKQKFGTYPTRYATRGFDITLDLVLRATAYGSVFENITSTPTTHLENKFSYVRTAAGGYLNTAAYILKYQDLYIIKISD